MKYSRAWALALLATALAAPATPAQVARYHMSSKGNLLVPTSNPSPIEVGTTRLYLFGDSSNEAADFADGSNSSFNNGTLGIAADFERHSGSASGGYAQSNSERTFSDSGLKLENTTVRWLGHFVQQLGPFFVLAASGAVVQSHTRAKLEGASSTAVNGYVDLTLGGRASLHERISIGLEFSPETSATDSLSGEVGGAEVREGHGQTTRFGVGLRVTYALAAEGSVERVEGSSDALDPARTAYTGSVGWALWNLFELEGALTLYRQEQLNGSQGPLAPPSDGIVLLGGVFVAFDPSNAVVVGFQALLESESATDTGDADFDATRLDSAERSEVRFSISGKF